MKILVIKMRYIGDTVLMTPLLKTLSQGVEGCVVDVLVNHGTHHVLEGNPHIRKTWICSVSKGKQAIKEGLRLALCLRKEKYDVVIDLTGNDRASLFGFATGARRRIGYRSLSFLRRHLVHTETIDAILEDLHNVDYNLLVAERLGIPVIDRQPFIHVSEESRVRVSGYLAKAGVDPDKPYVVIHPGARRPYKSWPPAFFAGLADRLVEQAEVQVVLAGAPSDNPVNAQIENLSGVTLFNLSGCVPLADFAALAQGARCLIGNDSAPIHISSAVKTPTVSLFGPTDWRLWHPRGERDQVVAAEFICMPCGHSRSECPLEGNYCMGTLSVERVWGAVTKALGIKQR